MSISGASDLPTTRNLIDIYAPRSPNGRFITPQVSKSMSMRPTRHRLSPDGQTLATINSGVAVFCQPHRNPDTALPAVQRVNVDALSWASFSSTGQRFYASGGENGNIWVSDVNQNDRWSVNLNGPAHPLTVH